MKSVDILNLDLRSLATFIAVLDESSVSRAAVRLGVSQSAVSHTLDRLRLAFGDPLFVKSGRGIVPTEYALRTGPHIRHLLDDLRTLPSGPPFDPATAEFTFTIAANDYQRDLLLPGLVKILREQAPGIHLQVIPSGIPNPDMLRKEACDLVISPHAPEATDIMQRGLMADRIVVFFDPSMREAPVGMDDYMKADHITVLFSSGERPALDSTLDTRGVQRKNTVTVSNFSGLPELLRGTSMLASAPERMSTQLMRDFAHVPLPFEYNPFTLLMLWHRRHQTDPAHRWLRNQVNSVAATMNGLND
ncbi:LysR family transcriptional regulator [Marinobacter sp. AL4B]|uniref:LysR family transcriptional regulator n=1 Tax=Marinobacter sp. AL4B TaxID=2871173 RepID=UPI001CAA6F0D|nr:LysR family transcriptional regulator [Marinobacter sp. AL4B]MBZ0335257.1 LysR family transcriptional regulator [Marinobacter sp. AL4B]